jgi:putative transposase
VSRCSLGWHISFSVEIEHEIIPAVLPSVGIDRGVAVAVAICDGALHRLPSRLKALDRQHRRAQKMASRRQRGSRRWKKAQARAARIKARGARIRKHVNHDLTTAIARRDGGVVLEDLNIKNMTKSAKGTKEDPGKHVRQKAGLHRSIAEQSWYQFETFLGDKLAERGGHLVKVNPAYTSQECAACGVTDKDSRASQALYRCRHGGTEHHADVNAAHNILRRNTSWTPVEAAKDGTGEAGSNREAA